MDTDGLEHTKRNYKCHLVFTPKFGRREIYGE